ncbi:hypothetical protein U1Q18_019532 [Sarracenia purpurea var. burkii]
MEVNIMSRDFIKPSSPFPNHPPTYNLSFFDQLAPQVHVPLLFFYPAGADGSKESAGCHERLETLKKSLSETLTLFYPQAGRFVKDDLLVDCNDQGVEFLEAKVNVRLMEFLGEGLNLELLNRFVPWDVGAATSAATPMVAIQVTAFECGGLALCVHVSHIIADGFTGSAFIHAWATASRSGIAAVTRPSFELPSLFPSRDLSAQLNFSLPNVAGAKVFTRWLVFDSATIAALKAKTKPPGSSNNDGRQPTRLEVVISTLWKAIIGATQVNHQGNPRPSVISLPVNLRGRTAIPTPKNACGNFNMLTPTRFTAEESEIELHHLVGLIRETIRNTLSICSKLSNPDEVFSVVVDSLNEVRKASVDEKIEWHNFTSMCGFPIYETDFGWGKPYLVSSAWLSVELVVLMDTKCGTGIEAWVNLNEPYILELEKDPDVAALIRK